MTQADFGRRSLARSVAAWVAALGLSLLMALPADAVRRRDIENPITNAPEELAFKELDVPAPPYPQDNDLIEYTATGRATGRFFVDGATLSVGEDKVIRFVLEVRSGSGVRNLTYAGVRCETMQWKDYAYGNPDGTWRADAGALWEPVERKRLNNYRASLVEEVFCLNGMRKGSNRGSAKTIVRLLKNPPAPDNRAPRILR